MKYVVVHCTVACSSCENVQSRFPIRSACKQTHGNVLQKIGLHTLMQKSSLKGTNVPLLCYVVRNEQSWCVQVLNFRSVSMNPCLRHRTHVAAAVSEYSPAVDADCANQVCTNCSTSAPEQQLCCYNQTILQHIHVLSPTCNFQ